MNPALWIAKTGLDAQQTRMAVTSNNLSNVSTTGFKRGRAQFEDLLYQTVRQPGGDQSTGRFPHRTDAGNRGAGGGHRQGVHAGLASADREQP